MVFCCGGSGGSCAYSGDWVVSSVEGGVDDVVSWCVCLFWLWGIVG